MAQESCNLDKEETEILKPSSSSSSPSPSPSPAHKEETAEKMKPLSSSPSSTPPKPSSSPPPPLFVNSVQEFSAKKLEKLEKAKEESKPLSRLGNRCSSCKKKVGLTGFRCRCGKLFCGQHRYSDIHDCSFDYKALAREQIAKENPVIRPAKIIKI